MSLKGGRLFFWKNDDGMMTVGGGIGEVTKEIQQGQGGGRVNEI